MKKKSKLWLHSIAVKCILSLIMLSLILSTVINYTNKNPEEYIAKVNGEKIDPKVFENMYLIEREKQKNILGKNFLKIQHNEQFKQKTYNYVLSQLINNILLEQYTKKFNFQVDNKEVEKVILNTSIFQKKKLFNKQKYLNYLASIHLNNNEYMQIIKKKINTEKLIHTIIDTDFILENEQKDILKLLSQKRLIQKSIFNIDAIIKKQRVSNIESRKYFEKNKKLFYTPEKFKISYLKLQPNTLTVKFTNKEIKNWYQKNIKNYFTPEKKQYSIIQIKRKNEALLILSEIKKSGHFSKIAREKSVDPISSVHGGNIGWISSNSIPNEIKQANLKYKNQISNIIPFKNEFLIIKLNDVLPKKQKKIDEVYNVIKKEIINKKQLELYSKLKKQLFKITKKYPNQFDKIIKKINLNAIETNWFNYKSIPQILNFPKLKKIIFNKKNTKHYNKKKSNLDLVFLNKNTLFLLNVKNYKKSKIKKFENVKNNIINRLKRIKAIEETKKISKKIISELKTGNHNLFKKFHLFFGKSEILSRYDNNLITSIVFSLPHPNKKEKIYGTYQDENDNIVIISLNKIYNENFSKEEEKIIFRYLKNNQIERIFNSILKDLRKNSNIVYKK